MGFRTQLCSPGSQSAEGKPGIQPFGLSLMLLGGRLACLSLSFLCAVNSVVLSELRRHHLMVGEQRHAESLLSYCTILKQNKLSFIEKRLILQNLFA